MLANLFNVPAQATDFLVFSFANQDLHRRVNDKILAVTGIRPPDYILDPINPGDPSWLYLHQAIHAAQNSVLGIAGNDLSDVDFNNPAQLASWIYLHANEHLQSSQKTGIF